MIKNKRGRKRLSSDEQYNSPHRRAVRKWTAKNPIKSKEWADKTAKKYRDWLNDYKSSHRCMNCQEKDPRCLDFHHRDKEHKVRTVSQMRHFSKKKLLSEIEKCDVICSNCHRKLTIRDPYQLS